MDQIRPERQIFPSFGPGNFLDMMPDRDTHLGRRVGGWMVGLLKAGLSSTRYE